MYLQFHGAADGVTGSLHRVHVGDRDVLLDCGLVQGHRAEADRRNRQLPDWASRAEALVLSHAHLDHSGNIPTLVKRGFTGNVYCTPPTRDLCSVMLRDSAMIQESDARYLNNRHKRAGSRERVDPLYDVEDAQRAVGHMISVPLHRTINVAPGVTATLWDAGHVLGSSVVQLDLAERGKTFRLLFTGDLGRTEIPLLRPPEVVKGVDLLLTESTYGDRLHPEIVEMDDKLAHIVRSTIERKGRVFIPTFALERAQEVLYALDRLKERGKVPPVPIYIDSPLAIAITEIYKLHPESLDPKIRERILERDDPFSPPGLEYVSDVNSSRALQRSGEPCIVIAGAGMCEGGRILHHFREGLGESRNSVVIVGFMAQHTLGRRLVEHKKQVKVFGVERDVRARVYQLSGLSAHADRDDLLAYAHNTAKVGRVARVAIVHGEDEAKQALADGLKEAGVPEVILSRPGDRIEL